MSVEVLPTPASLFTVSSPPVPPARFRPIANPSPVPPAAEQMKRAKRRGLARNAAVPLGNVGTADDVPTLKAALQHDEPLVREHAAWALTRLRSQIASTR